MRDKSRARPDRWSRVGGFRYVSRDGHWEWSDEVAYMHGYEPGTVTPTTELIRAHKHPEDRTTAADLIEQVRRHESPFSSRHRIIDTRGIEHLVIVVGDRFYDDRGAPAGTAGFYVDITEQFNTDMQNRLTEAVLQVSAGRAAINQAIGMLMLRYGVDADAAFALLSKLSQDSNVKLRVIAEHVVADTEARDAVLDCMTEPHRRTAKQRRARQHAGASRPNGS